MRQQSARDNANSPVGETPPLDEPLSKDRLPNAKFSDDQQIASQEGEGLALTLGAKISVVGIGASAGGLEALQQFFSAVPTDRQMAFVVVQHLSPDFK
ncbi:MAG: hypothetical protein KDD69_18980, partial [Bdellovibrionales bacterium]|nr:hypothetical protein [Bdellovibrionales bacterium]